MDYNYFKTLPKDVLIKMMIDINSQYLKDTEKERREWFVSIMEKNNMVYCYNVDCYNADTISNHDFIMCEICESFQCPECQNEKDDEKGCVYCVQCGISVCLSCNNSTNTIKDCNACHETYCNNCCCSC